MTPALVALAFSLGPLVPTADPPPTDAPVRKADWIDPKNVESVARGIRATRQQDIARVVAWGEELFPALQEILEHDDKYSEWSVMFVFGKLKLMKGDRSRFLDHALFRLGDKDFRVRRAALDFIASAGSEKEAGPVAVLLLDEKDSVRRPAARTLAEIGGPREVVVLDLIIKNARRYEEDGKLILDNFDLEVFEECRDKLKARLEKDAKKDEPKAKPREKKDEKK